MSRLEDPELGPAVSKYPPSSGYGNVQARNHTFGHMYRDNSSATPEAIDNLYPSGFPRQSVTPRKTNRTADRMLWRFKQDPDVEVRPVVPGTMVSTTLFGHAYMTKPFRTLLLSAASASVMAFDVITIK